MNQVLFRSIAGIVIACVALFASGCASIVHGGPRTVSINTSPSGADVVITKTNTGMAVHSGKSPMTVSLPAKGGYFRGQSYTVSFKLEGYQSTELVLRPTLSGWYLGNIVFGGLLGIIVVDPLTGAMWNLTPDKIDHSLHASQASLIKEQKGFLVVLASELSESERKQLVRIN